MQVFLKFGVNIRGSTEDGGISLSFEFFVILCYHFRVKKVKKSEEGVNYE